MGRLSETSDQLLSWFTWPWRTLTFIFGNKSLKISPHQYCISICSWCRDTLKLRGGGGDGELLLTCDVRKRVDNVHLIPQRWKLLGKTILLLSFIAPIGRRDVSDWWGQETELSSARLSPFRETWPAADQTFSSAKGTELTCCLSRARNSWNKFSELSRNIMMSIWPTFKAKFPHQLNQ